MRSNWRRAYEAARCEERETWRLCIHESAHALVAYTLGIKLKNLVVGRGVNDDSMSLQGYCAWKIRDDDPRSLVTAAIAGPSADAIFFDRSRSADSQDYRDARCAAERVVKAEGGEIETIIARARVDSESLIQQHATVIKKLAHELMQARWMELSASRPKTSCAGRA